MIGGIIGLAGLILSSIGVVLLVLAIAVNTMITGRL